MLSKFHKLTEMWFWKVNLERDRNQLFPIYFMARKCKESAFLFLVVWPWATEIVLLVIFVRGGKEKKKRKKKVGRDGKETILFNIFGVKQCRCSCSLQRAVLDK